MDLQDSVALLPPWGWDEMGSPFFPPEAACSCISLQCVLGPCQFPCSSVGGIAGFHSGSLWHGVSGKSISHFCPVDEG